MDINRTTLRFSRRAGEAFRGADYARSTELPERNVTRLNGRLVVALLTLSIVAAFFLAQ